MVRGKQQLLFSYLPEKTFDYGRIGVFARIDRVQGSERRDVNEDMILAKIRDEVRAWDPAHRPTLRDSILGDVGKFVFLDPTGATSSMFPLLFRCQNEACGHVVDRSSGRLPASATCPACRTGRLAQMALVRVHQCGALMPLSPPQCRRCGTSGVMALDRRGSERVRDYRWVCRRCRTAAGGVALRCPQCTDPQSPWMAVEVHRARRTYRPHYVTLLNLPGDRMRLLLATDGWWAGAAAKALDLPEMHGLSLENWAAENRRPSNHDDDDSGIGREDLDALLRRLDAGEITAAEMSQEVAQKRFERRAARGGSAASLALAIEQKTGVSRAVWQRSGQEMLEFAAIRSSATTVGGPVEHLAPETRVAARRLGLADLSVITDFPITRAVYGYSRIDNVPGACRINPFPPDPMFSGRFPVLTDVVQADALLVRLDPDLVLTWLAALGHPLHLPPGSNEALAKRACFVDLFDGLQPRSTLTNATPQARLVFGLLHSLSHLCVRKAALYCGLDQTSMSEYILPKSLTVAAFSNHRSARSIGAFVSLFEQSLPDWLQSVTGASHCIYDPVCADTNGNCHACLHLAETSCRFF